MSPLKRSKQYKSVSRRSSAIYQITTNNLSAFTQRRSGSSSTRGHRRHRGQNLFGTRFRNILSCFNLSNIRSIPSRLIQCQSHCLPFYWLILLIIILTIINYKFGIFEITANDIHLPSQTISKDYSPLHIDTSKCSKNNMSMTQQNYMAILMERSL
ncbi:unnamed protein product [Rotaria sordida]|uniref:Uncharacterized protein n=1 Tax=Rotaria sordida TaxID=392033 RepID=A0A814YD57_9BILA|nr:unnamed protein product [Rotaria sordida]